MVDPAARRLIVASAIRLHVAERLGTGVLGSDLVACARSLRGTEGLERRYGLVFSPAFPGVSAGVEGARLVLACRVSQREEPVAVAVVTLVVGRSPLVTAAPPETPVPAWWSAL